VLAHQAVLFVDRFICRLIYSHLGSVGSETICRRCFILLTSVAVAVAVAIAIAIAVTVAVAVAVTVVVFCCSCNSTLGSLQYSGFRMFVLRLELRVPTGMTTLGGP